MEGEGRGRMRKEEQLCECAATASVHETFQMPALGQDGQCRRRDWGRTGTLGRDREGKGVSGRCGRKGGNMGDGKVKATYPMLYRH
jgi:hypothetical protein